MLDGLLARQLGSHGAARRGEVTGEEKSGAPPPEYEVIDRLTGVVLVTWLTGSVLRNNGGWLAGGGHQCRFNFLALFCRRRHFGKLVVEMVDR